MEELTLTAVLNWLMVSGGGTVAASWILEQIPWFQKLVAEAKKWVYFGVAALISLGSWATVTFVPSDVLAALATPFAIVAGVFVTVFIGETFHKVTK